MLLVVRWKKPDSGYAWLREVGQRNPSSLLAWATTSNRKPQVLSRLVWASSRKPSFLRFFSLFKVSARSLEKS